MFSQIVGQNLIRLRRTRDWKREDLTALAKVEVSHLGKCERGAFNPTLATLRRLAKALGVPLSHLFNEGTPEAPDYTSLTFFIRDSVPYFWELEKVYDPLELLDFTGELLLDNVTLRDMDEAVARYKQNLIYTHFTRLYRLEDGEPYYSTGIRMEYRRDAFRQTLKEVRDIDLNREAAEDLARRMTDGKLDPVHLHDVIEDFCAGEAILL